MIYRTPSLHAACLYTQGQFRLLEYGNDARNIFFTTSLQNSVQAYSSRQFRLLDSLQTHPSPPTVLALSSTSHLLISASVEPPTIYLTNLTLRTPPISLRPSCSSSAVVAASFHPERANVFLLAFTDGVLAIYDAVHLSRNGGKGGRRDGAAGSGKVADMRHIKGLHAAGAMPTSSSPDDLLEAASFGGYDEGAETVSAGSRSSGITAVSFLPGYTARAVSAGADGRCHIIDFEAHNRKESRIVASWHARGPATSMSIIQIKERGSTTPKGRNPSRRDETSGNVSNGSLIVIGRLDGRVCLFSDSGTLQGEMVVDPAGGPILDVEWMEGPGDTVSKPSGRPRAEVRRSNSRPKPMSRNSSRSSTAMAKRNSMALARRQSSGSLLAAGRQVQEEVFIMEGGEDEIAGFAWRDAADVYAAKYMDMFSPVKQLVNNGSSETDNPPKPANKKSATLLEHPSALELQLPLSGLEPDKPISKAIKRVSRASIRPRPGPRRGSQAAMRGSHTFRLGGSDEGKATADMRRAAVPGRPTRGFALFAPYMDRKVMVGGTGSGNLGRSNMNAATASRAKKGDQPGEDVWSEVVTSPSIPARTHSQKPATNVSKKESRKIVSFQHALAREGRDDIVIQGQLYSIPSVSEPAINIPHPKHGEDHTQKETSSKDTVVHTSSKEKSTPDFKIHEDSSHRSRILHSPHRIRTATRAETVASTPLEEMSHNVDTTKSSKDPPKTPAKDKERTHSPKDTHAFFNEKLEEAKAALADDMRGFRAEIFRQFEEHRRKIGDALVMESIARQKVVEENRLLREELSKANGRRY